MALNDQKSSAPVRSEEYGALFRPDAIRNQQQRLPGTVLISRIGYRWILVLISLILAVGICCFLAFAEYTRRIRVSGQVQLTHKIAHVYASVDGTISRTLVKEGQTVKAGTPLFAIESDKLSVALGKTQESIGAELNEKRHQVQSEKHRRSVILAEQGRSLDVQVSQLEIQIAQSMKEDVSLKALIAINDANLDRYRGLAADGYFPLAQLQQKEQENLNLKVRQASLEKGIVVLQTELLQTRSQQKNFPLQAENELSTYDQRLTDLNVQLAETEGKREILVFSQLAGKVTAPLWDVGQSVTASTLLVSVLPLDTQFVVHLYVPSKATGFITTGSPVQLRYEAFPYEKFGQYGGHVIEVSRTSLAPANFQAGSDTHEPLYRIVVALDQQSVKAYGKNVALEDGMKVDADILLDTRKIYEWVLEPLLAVTGRYSDTPR